MTKKRKQVDSTCPDQQAIHVTLFRLVIALAAAKTNPMAYGTALHHAVELMVQIAEREGPRK